MNSTVDNPFITEPVKVCSACAEPTDALYNAILYLKEQITSYVP